MAAPRLFIASDLAHGARYGLDSHQAHYLLNVMRLRAGDPVRVFNGRDGEWDAIVTDSNRREPSIETRARRREQQAAADIHLVFAPLKKSRTDFIIEKATELGVSALRPIFTRRTVAERVNEDRMASIAREAAEQCERLDVPKVHAPERLEGLLRTWPSQSAGRKLLFCDEAAAPSNTPWSDNGHVATPPVWKALFATPGVDPGPWAVLIGPEGGFDAVEREALRSTEFIVTASLGPRILRADTAAIAALSLWQSVLGDWK